MASDALEEKINKIRLQNEEIRRRHEEVEADKKNAAKLNALVQLVPSDDWPERKEPPEFSAPPKNVQKQKSVGKEHNDRPSQHYPSIQERIGKKDHKFAQGEGPPPDPKYNFLADSEREMRGADDGKNEEDKSKSKNKTARGGTRKRGGSTANTAGGGGGGSREAFFKDNRGPNAFHSKEESLPEYEAWRAERNKIDEARIKRQKTAEGNWRREWDSNKVASVDKEPFRKGDSNRKDYEKRNNYYNNDYSNRGHGGSGSRTYHGSQKCHTQQDHRRPHQEQVHEFKRDSNPPAGERSIAAIDKNVKVTINQAKGPVMSVKVNSPSIAGTGRVGPRQKSRVTYSSQSDAEMSTHEVSNFSRQKSFDEKTATASLNNGQKIAPKSPFAQRKKDGNAKSPFPQRKEYKSDESSGRPNKNPKVPKNEVKDQRQSNNTAAKPQRVQRRSQKPPIDRQETASTSDNAIPSEYNPEKPLNPVDSTEPKVNSEINSENISDKPNVADLALEDLLTNANTTGQNDSGNVTEQNDSVNVAEQNDSGSVTEQNDSVNVAEQNDSGSVTEQNDFVNVAEQNDSVSVTEQNHSVNVAEQNDSLSSTEQNDSVFAEQNDSGSVTEQNDSVNVAEQNDSVSVTDQNDSVCSTEERDSLCITEQTVCNILEKPVTDNNETTENHEKGASLEADETVSNAEHVEKIEQNLEEKNNQDNDGVEEKQIKSEISDSNEQIQSENKEDNIENLIKEVECERKEESNNEKSVAQELQTAEIVKEVNNESPNTEENILGEIKSVSEEVNTSIALDNIDKNEIDQNNKLIEINIMNTSESQQIDDSKVESTFTDVTNVIDNTINLEKLEKNNLKEDDNILENKINDESIEINKTKPVEIIVDSQNISVNDSGFIDYSDNLNNTSIIESNQENNEKNSQETDKLDSKVSTKEICEKTEICDIRAASNEIPQAVEVQIEKNEDKQELSNALEGSTKDCEVNIKKDINESAETSKINDIQKVTDNESNLKPFEENLVEEKSTKIATEESKKD